MRVLGTIVAAVAVGFIFAGASVAATTSKPAAPSTGTDRSAPAAATPADAAPAILPTVSLDDLQAALQDAGLKAKITKDSTGNYIQSATGGATFFVSLSGCGDKPDDPCSVVVFESGGWKPNTLPTLDSMNTMGDNSLFGWGTAYKSANDGLYYLNYRASLVGGVTQAWIEDTADRFGLALQKFTTAMNQ